MQRRWKGLAGGLLASALMMSGWAAPAPQIAVAAPGMTTQAGIGFEPPATYPVGSMSFGVATADFNRDGIADLASTSKTSGGIHVLLGQADGSFGPATPYATGPGPERVAAGDFNKDGRPDLAVADRSANNFRLLIGAGTGVFSPTESFTLNVGVMDMHIADLNADGNQDVIATGALQSNNVGVWMGDGTSFLGVPIFSTVGSGGQGSTVADFNHDGRLDIAMSDMQDNRYTVAFGNGAGAFGGAVSYDLPGLSADVAHGDFNRDGNLDLAVTMPGETQLLGVAFGRPGGSFGPPALYPLTTRVGWMAAADLDRDGSLDLAVADYDGPGVLAFAGQPNGGFAPAVKIGLPSRRYALAAGDFNRDGAADLALTGDAANVAVLLNATPDDCLTPLLKVGPAVAFGGGTPGVLGGGDVADLNEDGHLDLAVASKATNSVVFRYGDGRGGLGGGGAVAVGPLPADVAAGDFNNDSHADLVAPLSGINRTAVLVGNGAGAFTRTLAFAYAGPVDAVTIDANRDGDLDFATVSYTMNMRLIAFNYGNANFGAGGIGYGAFSGPVDQDTADFNRDGAPDFASAESAGNRVDVRLNSGPGSFGGPFLAGVMNNPSAVVAGDFNRDGIPDIAAASRGSNSVSVLVGSGATAPNAFTLTATLATGAPPADVLGQDMDNDGRLDLVVSYATAASVSVYRGNGDGTFGAGSPYGPAIANHRLIAGDFNQDGRPDLAVPDAAGDSVRMLLSNCPAALSQAYLPQIRVDRPILLAPVNPQPIPTRPVTVSGQTYYTATIALPGPLPAGGRFYFSSAPDQVKPVKVDDELVVTVNGQQRLVAFTTYPVLVEVPRAEITQWIGKSIVVNFRDKFGSVVGSDPVWLIWAP